MSKRQLTFFAAFVIFLVGICLVVGQIANAKERNRDKSAPRANQGGALVSGTVLDDSGHGWPLYARIDISGFPGSPVFTDPVTGAYQVDLDPGVTYTFDVTAVAGGYDVASRDVTPPGGSSTEDFHLVVSALCTAAGYAPGGATGVLENFDAGVLPLGWTNIDNLGNGQVWEFDDPCFIGNNTGGSNGFATVNSDCYGPSGTQDTELRTPVLDLTGQATVTIDFDTEFNWYDFGLDEKADVDVSTDGGGTWTNVLRYQGGDVLGPHHETLDISGIAGNQPNVVVRFHFWDANFEFWWQIDNVDIGTGTIVQCLPVSGGLVSGNVTDANTSAGVNGATIASVDAPAETTTSFATPDDPNVEDGFYVLFSTLTGTHDFTATASNYGSDTHLVNVVADAVTEQDFVLPAGIIETDPDSLEATVDLGSSTTLQLTLSNTGGADADFKLQEGNDLPALFTNGHGAPLNQISGNFGPWRHGIDRNNNLKHKIDLDKKGRKNKIADRNDAVNSPADPPWTDINEYPMSIMDNTAAVIDGLVYSVGGFDGGSNLTAGFVYDPAADTWSPIANMSVEREKPAAAAIDGLLYVTGGWQNTGVPSDVLEIYDPASDSWSTGASIPIPYAAGTGVNLDGQFYVIGGCNDTCGFTDVQVYDPGADSWSTAADYPENTSWLGCGAINGQIYCAGGVSDAGSSAHTYVYDPSADSWTQLADMPQDQWAPGYIASGESLYIAGGVTDGFNTITNETFAYDTDTGTWTQIENSNNTVYRGGSACGFYKIGGSIGGFSPVPDSEVYPGLTECEVSDVPWLSENPTEGTVPAGDSVTVDVTLDTTVLNQPGDYFAHIKVKENTPTSVPDVGVTLHVPLPAGWGYLEGTINALGRCDVPAGGLEGATVFVDTLGVDWTLKTDENGFYKVAFPATDSPVTVTVSAEDFVGQSVSGVVVTEGNTTTQNFDLRLDAPCGSKTPASFDVTLSEGGTTTQTLTLTNDGAAALNFEVFESTFDLPPQVNAPKKKHNRNLKNNKKDKPTAGTLHPRSIRSRPLPTQAAQDPQATATWFGGSPLPIGTVRYSHARCDTEPNVFYIISGFDASFSYTDAAWRYDAETNTWTELDSYPTASEGSTAVCYQGKIYVMGGFDDSFNPTDTLFIYDIASDTWSDRGVPLPRTVWGASAGAWDGKVFLIGGDNFGVTDEVNIYDIATETWTTGTSMPAAAQLPGFFQTGNYVYVVGGWDANSPGANLAATQRYDMATDTWESGPTLNFPRSDLALAATDTALYSIGGDEDGGGFFDAINTVERLDLSTWPAGNWEDFSDPLPVALSSNNGGFCTEAIHVGGSVGEFWSVGGGDQFGNILGYNLFSPTDEHCFSIFSDVPWLEVTLPDGIAQVEGSVPPDSSLVLNVHFNAAGLAPGDYTASIVITTNDDAAPQFTIPVTLHVGPALFNDQFNDDVLDPNWKYKKNWTEGNGVVTVTSNNDPGTAIATPVFPGCLNCSISTSASTSGGNNGKLSFYGWWVSNKTNIELQVKEDVDKVTIREKVNGKIKKKQTASVTIDPNTFYAITMTYNGTDIVVNIDGTDVLTFTPKGTVQMGTVGFLVKGTGAFDYIVAN